MEKKTPLYEQHIALKGRIVPFAGYLLPVQYPTGVIAEHMAVRQHVGLFDVSHMGEALIEGPQAEQALNYILSNQFTGMPVGKARYTLMLNETGGVVDDLIVYRRSETSFFLVLNAANTEKDLAWLRAHLQGEASLTDLSDRVAQIAVQGPEADKVLSGLADPEALPKKYYSFVERATVAGIPCMVSFLLSAYHSSLCCLRKASMKCKNAMDLRLFLWCLHRPDRGLPQNLRIEARAPVAGEDGAEILGRGCAVWVAVFVHDVDHGVEPLAVDCDTQGLLAVEMRPALIDVQRLLILGL